MSYILVLSSILEESIFSKFIEKNLFELLAFPIPVDLSGEISEFETGKRDF